MREPAPVFTNRLQCEECGRVSRENEPSPSSSLATSHGDECLGSHAARSSLVRSVARTLLGGPTPRRGRQRDKGQSILQLDALHVEHVREVFTQNRQTVVACELPSSGRANLAGGSATA